MSERQYSFIFLGSTLLLIIFLSLFQFVANIHHIGIYEFITQFDLLLWKFLGPFLVSLIITFFVHLFIHEHSFTVRLVGRGMIPWFWALLYGMYSVLSLEKLILRKNMLLKSGVNIGTVWVYVLSQILLSLPLLLILFFLHYQILIPYVIISLLCVIFLGALGELLQYKKIVKGPETLVRQNPNFHISFIVPFWKHLSLQEIFLRGVVKCMPLLKYCYIPLIYGVALAALFSSAIGASLQTILFQNVFIGFLSLLLISFIVPMFALSAFVFGYNISLINDDPSFIFIALVVSAVWRIILKKQTQPSEVKRIFFVLFIFIAFAGSYLLSLFA